MRAFDDASFSWNKRECNGTALHVHVLASDYQKAREVCEEHPELVRSKFTYESKYNNKIQEGSGEAIHIAASKGDLEMVKFLFSQNANLAAMVTRDREDHYNALHAAAFAEGNKLEGNGEH